MMDIVLLIIGIIIIILLVVLILRTGKEQPISFPSLDGVKSQRDVMQKDNRDSQSALRQEVSASMKENISFLSQQLTVNQKQASDEQIRMSRNQREQLDKNLNQQFVHSLVPPQIFWKLHLHAPTESTDASKPINEFHVSSS